MPRSKPSVLSNSNTNSAKFRKSIPYLPVHRPVHFPGYSHGMGSYHIQVLPDISEISWFETVCHSVDRIFQSFSVLNRGNAICEIMYAPIGLDSIKSKAKWMVHISAVKIPQCPGILNGTRPVHPKISQIRPNPRCLNLRFRWRLVPEALQAPHPGV
jgi:hypothetical protein